MMKEKIILASQSKSRYQLLRGAGFDKLEQIPSGVDEDEIKKSFAPSGAGGGAGIEELALCLARAKAEKVSRLHPTDWVIGADQILLFENKTYDKAKTIDEAREFFQLLRGKSHHLVGAQVVARAGSVVWVGTSKIALSLRDFSDELLEDYLTLMGARVLEAVGGYQLEGAGVQFFDSIQGDYFAILGLDLLPLLAALRDLGAIKK